MELEKKITLESDPVWSDLYEEERERILNNSGDGLLDVFHVGSTAIPDLPGASSLDVIAVFTEDEPMRAAADALTEGSYETGHDESDCIVLIREGDDYAVFIKMHIQDDERVRNQLIFREYLRDNSEARREYERVKREAAAEHPINREAYTQAKSEVVGSLLEQACNQGYAGDIPEFA